MKIQARQNQQIGMTGQKALHKFETADDVLHIHNTTGFANEPAWKGCQKI